MRMCACACQTKYVHIKVRISLKLKGKITSLTMCVDWICKWIALAFDVYLHVSHLFAFVRFITPSFHPILWLWFSVCSVWLIIKRKRKKTKNKSPRSLHGFSVHLHFSDTFLIKLYFINVARLWCAFRASLKP